MLPGASLKYLIFRNPRLTASIWFTSIPVDLGKLVDVLISFLLLTTSPTSSEHRLALGFDLQNLLFPTAAGENTILEVASEPFFASETSAVEVVSELSIVVVGTCVSKMDPELESSIQRLNDESTCEFELEDALAVASMYGETGLTLMGVVSLLASFFLLTSLSEQ